MEKTPNLKIIKLIIEDPQGEESTFAIDIDSSLKVSELIRQINIRLRTRNISLSKNNHELLQKNLSISENHLCFGSTVKIVYPQAGGYTLPKFIVNAYVTIPKSDRIEEIKETDLVRFKPIISPGEIPYYTDILQIEYPDGELGPKSCITRYTGDEYEKLKVQCYTLQLDEVQKTFLIGLFKEVWGVHQENLPSTVYHICNLDEESFEWYKPGLVFITPAFVSTSVNPNFRWSGNCKWEITLKPGQRAHAADVSEWSYHKEEKEVLICCCTRFRVISKQKDHNGKAYYIYLEYLDFIEDNEYGLHIKD
jgi:hypothetical protein